MKKQNRKWVWLLGLLVLSLGVYGCEMSKSTQAFALDDEPDGQILFYVKDDGLYAKDLTSKRTILIDGQKNISGHGYNIEASPDAKYIAYMAGDSLFVSAVSFNRDFAPREIIGGVQNNEPIEYRAMSYVWADEHTLICARDATMWIFDMLSDYNTIISDGPEYRNFIAGKNGMVYAQRWSYDYGKIEEGNIAQYADSPMQCDIVAFNINNWAEEKSLLKGTRMTESDLGEIYTIAGISEDKTKLFLWPHTYSASLAADGTGGIIVYDLEAPNEANPETVQDIDDGILMYEDHLAANPVDSNLAVINAGYGREMWTNKKLQLFDVKSREIKDIDSGCEVTMTPSYSPNGETLVYSGGKDGHDLYDKSPYAGRNDADESISFNQIMARSIYTYDMKTKKVKRLTTKENICDFAPMFTGNEGDIIFVRADDANKNLSLILLEEQNGQMVESVLVEKLKTSTEGQALFGYYGHMGYKP